MKSVGFGGVKSAETPVTTTAHHEYVVSLSEMIFAILGVPACLVVAEKGKYYREVFLNREHPGFLERFIVNAHLKHAAVSEEPETDSPDLFRRTPIVFPKDSGKMSCELKGGAGFGSQTAALSGLAGRCDLALVSLVLARQAGFDLRCLPDMKAVRLADEVEAQALQVVTTNIIDLVQFVERVCDMPTELTEGNERGMFVRTPDDPRPAPVFGFVISVG